MLDKIIVFRDTHLGDKTIKKSKEAITLRKWFLLVEEGIWGWYSEALGMSGSLYFFT